MSNTISFVRGATLRALTANDYNSIAIQPFVQEILNSFVESDDLQHSILKASQKYAQIAEVFFDIDNNNVVESFSLKEPYLFPEQNPAISLSYVNTKLAHFIKTGKTKVIKDSSIWPDIHRLLQDCGQSNLSYDEICQRSSVEMIELLDNLLKTYVVKEQPSPPRILPDESGVFRLQHAALLYRSRTTGLLVDPQLHSNYGISDLRQDITRSMLEGYVDGILISHYHYDHWHLPTLMQFPADIPIIVPKVPRGSITCDDMEAKLKDLGFEHVIAVDWYADPIQIGDFAIHVLPFYGEQPLVPEYNTFKHPALRNWGNTYLLQTNDYSSWFLIDAGSDPKGSMVEVAEYVRQTFGRIDFILSNFQPLSFNSIGSDLSSWGLDILGTMLSNPPIFSTIGKSEGWHLATLGPAGVAAICQIVDASACLPYAHSWANLGSHTEHDEPLIRATQNELSQRKCTTAVIPWRIGDSCLRRGKEIVCEPAFY